MHAVTGSSSRGDASSLVKRKLCGKSSDVWVGMRRPFLRPWKESCFRSLTRGVWQGVVPFLPSWIPEVTGGHNTHIERDAVSCWCSQELDQRALYLSERILQCQPSKPRRPEISSTPPWPPGSKRQGRASCWASGRYDWDTCCDARHGPIGNMSCWKRRSQSFERCCMRIGITQAE